MDYDNIEKKDAKTLIILYKVIESDDGKLGFKDRIYRKMYCNVDITSKEEMCIYNYLSNEGYIKPKEDLRKDGIMVYYQAKDLDNRITEDGEILMKRLRKRLFSTVFMFLINTVKSLCTG